MRRLNVALAIWAAFWIAIAAYTAYEVSALRSLSHTVVKAGTATEATGHALAARRASPVRRRAALAASPRRPSRRVPARVRAGPLTASTSTGSRSSSASRSHSSRPCRSCRSTSRCPVGWRRDRHAVRRAVPQWDGEPDLEASSRGARSRTCRFASFASSDYAGTSARPPTAEPPRPSYAGSGLTVACGAPARAARRPYRGTGVAPWCGTGERSRLRRRRPGRFARSYGRRRRLGRPAPRPRSSPRRRTAPIAISPRSPPRRRRRVAPSCRRIRPRLRSRGSRRSSSARPSPRRTSSSSAIRTACPPACSARPLPRRSRSTRRRCLRCAASRRSRCRTRSGSSPARASTGRRS